MTTNVSDQRLQRLEDLEAIRQLFIDYGYYLDQCDFTAYANLFAEDAELLVGPLGRARGRIAIEELMRKQLTGRQGMTYHLITNPVIKLDGDAATSHVTWVVLSRNSEGAPHLAMLGHHSDQLIRVQGQWKFQRREGHVDLPAKLLAKNA
ncbi:MAG TPA: nuclear transport factor 2 family protein [Halioglobus sp.]